MATATAICTHEYEGEVCDYTITVTAPDKGTAIDGASHLLRNYHQDNVMHSDSEIIYNE